MNKQRRKEVNRLLEQIERIKLEIESLHDEEQTAYDNLPGSLQETPQGFAMGQSAEYLSDAFDAISECADAMFNAQHKED